MDRQRARRIAAAAGKARAWTVERDAEIVAAHAAGAGLREIGRAAELSHPAVKKIVEKHARAGADPAQRAGTIRRQDI